MWQRSCIINLSTFMDMTRRNVGVIIAVLIVGSNVVETTDLLKAADDWSRDKPHKDFRP